MQRGCWGSIIVKLLSLQAQFWMLFNKADAVSKITLTQKIAGRRFLFTEQRSILNYLRILS